MRARWLIGEMYRPSMTGRLRKQVKGAGRCASRARREIGLFACAWLVVEDVYRIDPTTEETLVKGTH